MAKPHLRLIYLLGVIVPRRLRADWRQEWESELGYRETMLEEWERLDWRAKLDLLRRSFGAFWDALWMQSYRWEDEMIQDLRFGLRMLWNKPAFTLVAIFTLALGIGANTAIFSVVSNVLLRPLPYEDSDRLVYFTESNEEFGELSIAYPNFLDWQQQQSVFERMAVYNRDGYTLTGTDEPEQLRAAQATAEFFDVLKVSAALGRVYTKEDDQPGAAAVVVISHGLWQQRFGSDPQIINQNIILNDNRYTVIGVMPKGFLYPQQVDIWVPLGAFANGAGFNARGNHPGLLGIARLKSGVTVEQARADMTAIAARLSKQYPQTNEGLTVTVLPLKERTIAGVQTALWVLLAAVGCVLLIACANVANLLMARAASRKREIAVRIALGASRWRIARQLLTESLVLALLGALPGLFLAQWIIGLILNISPDSIPRADEIRIDSTVLGFTCAIAVLTGLLFGVFPALQSGRSGVQSALKEAARSVTGGRSWTRNILVVSEVALTMVLLVGAGLLLRSFERLLKVDPGFDCERLLTFNVALPVRKYKTQQQQAAFFQLLKENLSTLPGVKSVGYSSGLPLGNNGWIRGFVIAGRPLPPPSETPRMEACLASPDYFRTMSIPLIAGRWFDEHDNRDRLTEVDLSKLDEQERFSAGLNVIVIDEEFARRYFPGEDPIGKSVQLLPVDKAETLTIIGVAGRVKMEGLREDSGSVQAYFPYLQMPFAESRITIRSTLEPKSLTAAARAKVLKIDPNLPIFNVNTMEDLRAEVMAPDRLNLTLLAMFAGLAMLLALIGIYGVISYSVTQRTQEIGLRMALGAQTTSILRLIVGQGMRLAFAGVSLGLIAAVALTRLMESLLFGVSATDPLTFIVIASLLIFASLLACYIPARSATKVDPMIALKHE